MKKMSNLMRDRIARAMYCALYRVAFPENWEAAWRKYHQTSTYKAARLKYRRSNKDKLVRKRYQKSAKGKATQQRFWQSKKGRIAKRMIDAKRRARKKQVAIGDSKAIAKIYARAQELRQWFDVVVDHKIPLARGGAHTSGNLQIIYAYENSRKQAKLNYKPQVVFK